jgi:serine protease inhibitor ecotin
MVLYATGSETVITDNRQDAIIPRVGEYVQAGGFKYTVLMVTHDHDNNLIRVSLTRHYKLNQTCHAVRKELSNKG